MSKMFVRSSMFLAVMCLAGAGFLSVAVAQQSANSSMGSSSQMGSSTANLSVADKKFVKEAAQGGMAEVELGQLAVQKASSDDVKKFGQRMIDDHSKANDKLKQVAANQGITLPSSLSAKDEATKARLSKLSGEQFDKAYMRDMLKDHKADIAAFKTESSSGQDAAVKNFASQTLPTLEDHLKDAESIAPKVMQASNTTMPKASQR
jgi:putative membrane protein